VWETPEMIEAYCAKILRNSEVTGGLDLGKVRETLAGDGAVEEGLLILAESIRALMGPFGAASRAPPQRDGAEALCAPALLYFYHLTDETNGHCVGEARIVCASRMPPVGNDSLPSIRQNFGSYKWLGKHIASPLVRCFRF
jgi:hypothetical protein